MTALTIVGPGMIVLGEDATFYGRIASDTLPVSIEDDIGSLPVSIEDEEGNLLDTVDTGEDGSFEYRASRLDVTGPRSLTARFDEQGYLSSSSASASFAVVAPTLLTVDGPALAKMGDIVELTGSLRRADGEPISGVPVWAGNAGEPLLLTGADGSFSREFLMEPELGESEVEAEVKIPFGFDGTSHLAQALGGHTLTVGVPRVTAEPPETTARGEAATLRGAVFIGNRPLPDAVVTLTPGLQAGTTETGTFVLRYPVPADAPLGRSDLLVAVPALGIETVVPIEIKSAVNLIAVPLGSVRPGRDVMLQATLYDDSGTGIAGAVLRTSQGVEAVTDGQGMALLTLTVPDSEDLLTVPVTFTYRGDEHHLPLTYFMGVPVTPSSFNWLLWAGLPALLAMAVGSVYAVRRFKTFSFPVAIPVAIPVRLLRRAEPEVPAVEERPDPVADSLPEPEPVPDPEPTRLEIAFDQPAQDLPGVWGLGEQVSVLIRLSEEGGRNITGAAIEAGTPGGAT